MPYADADRLREYQRDQLRDRRADALRGQSCAFCGATEDLEFHHRDPREKDSHAVWSWTPARRARELDKCDVLCQSCHTRVTMYVRAAVAAVRSPHGTNGCYSAGCRCADCREAHRLKGVAWKARRAVA